MNFYCRHSITGFLLSAQMSQSNVFFDKNLHSNSKHNRIIYELEYVMNFLIENSIWRAQEFCMHCNVTYTSDVSSLKQNTSMEPTSNLKYMHVALSYSKNSSSKEQNKEQKGIRKCTIRGKSAHRNDFWSDYQWATVESWVTLSTSYFGIT